MALIKFTHLADKLKYPSAYRAQLSTYHSDIIGYVSEHYVNRAAFRRKVVQTMNTISYRIVSGDSIPSSWRSADPLQGLPLEDDSVLSYSLNKLGLYIDESLLEWDVVPSTVTQPSEVPPVKMTTPIQMIPDAISTPKEDLFIQPPLVPRFLFSKPYLSGKVNNDVLTIYTSLPEIPTKQNEISVSTDVSKMTDIQLMSLFPNHYIRTRAASMYQPIPGLEFDPVLGVLPKISGYSSDEVRKNIIQYPHIFQLKRYGPDDDVLNFYPYVEIDNKLVRLSDVWSESSDTKDVPFSQDYMKEYSVRKYLLDRDNGINHRYPMYGSLDPYLTLFTTPDEYRQLGVDIASVELARKCVLSRVSYKQSRNPIIRRLSDA